MRSPCTSCSLRNRWALFLPSGAHLPRTSGSPLFNVLSKTGQRRRQRAEQVLGLVQIKSRCTSIPKCGSIFLNLDQGSHEGVDQATKSTFRRPCPCLCPSYCPCHSPSHFSCHCNIPCTWRDLKQGQNCPAAIFCPKGVCSPMYTWVYLVMADHNISFRFRVTALRVKKFIFSLISVAPRKKTLAAYC